MIYKAVRGQNLYDVCLITYGSLDFLVKLATDNGVENLNSVDLSGIEFTYDSSLVVNQAIQQQLSSKYGTSGDIGDEVGVYGSGSFYYGGSGFVYGYSIG